MRKVIISASFALVLIANRSFAQAAYLKDVNGRTITAEEYVEVKGSPYLTTTWNKGSVKFTNGNNLGDVELMYDQVKGQLLYKKPESDDITMAFTDPVQEFLIHNVNGRDRGFIKDKQSDGLAGSIFYEILYNGNTKLVKHTQKQISEQSQYGSATKTKLILEKFSYFLLLSSGDMIQLQKDTEPMLTAIGSKRSNVEEYLKMNKLNLKSESNLISFAKFFNTLN